MEKLNHATKYTVIVCIVLLVFNIIFGCVLTTSAAKAMRIQINARMLDISNTAASMLNGDELAKLTAEDYDTPQYQRALSTLTYFQENIALEYIYCISKVGDKTFVFGVDPTIEDPGEFGSPIVYTEALDKASMGKASVDENPYKDAWGEFYSSYSPVFDSNGNVAGVVAVDFSAHWYRDQIKHMYFIVATFLAFALCCSIVLAIIIASQYNKLFMTMVDKMNELSTGIETLIDEVSTGYDIGENADSFAADSGNDIKNAIDLLGEKICVMQLRLAKQIEIIRSHAYIDGLTGLNNRNSYMEYLQILEKKIIDDPNLVFTVVVFDINQLKVINDDYGHDTGDKLIVEISKDIRDCFGRNRIYRVGGDEFVAIMDEPDTSERIAQIKATIDRKNKESPIFHNPEVEIGLSVGAATYDPSKDRTYSEVFNRADNEMYADKRAFYQNHEDRRKKRG